MMNRMNTQLPQVQPPDNKPNWFASHYLWGYAFLAFAFLLAVAFIYQLEYSGPEEARVCIQVITSARNPETGEVKEFPTPCDVPEGWEQVNQVPTQGKGVIKGKLSYPSEGIPPMTVCADNLISREKICIETAYNQADYEVEVPTGKYYVYAIGRGMSAYYSEFVTCGLNVKCESHAPIVVEINNNDVKQDIDPGDWYNY